MPSPPSNTQHTLQIFEWHNSCSAPAWTESPVFQVLEAADCKHVVNVNGSQHSMCTAAAQHSNIMIHDAMIPALCGNRRVHSPSTSTSNAGPACCMNMACTLGCCSCCAAHRLCCTHAVQSCLCTKWSASRFTVQLQHGRQHGASAQHLPTRRTSCSLAMCPFCPLRRLGTCLRTACTGATSAGTSMLAGTGCRSHRCCDQSPDPHAPQELPWAH